MPEAKQVGAAFKGIGSEAMDDNLYGKALESTNGLQFSDERIKFNTAAATYLLAKGLTSRLRTDLVKLSTSIRDDAEKWHKQQQDDIRQQVDSEIYGSHDAAGSPSTTTSRKCVI